MGIACWKAFGFGKMAITLKYFFIITTPKLLQVLNLTLLQVIRNKGFFSMQGAALISSKNAFEIKELLAKNRTTSLPDII